MMASTHNRTAIMMSGVNRATRTSIITTNTMTKEVLKKAMDKTGTGMSYLQ